MMSMRIFTFTVTLRVDSSGTKPYFKGFLIEARNAWNLNEAVGSFRLVDPTMSQLLNCDDKDVSICFCICVSISSHSPLILFSMFKEFCCESHQ